VNVTRPELEADERWLAELELQALMDMYPMTDLTHPNKEEEERAIGTKTIAQFSSYRDTTRELQ